jgi:oligopeptide/dipeptide ABC transporter ATP-binding protein
MSEILLETHDLSKHFPLQSGFLRGKTIGYVKAVDEVSFTIRRGETFGLVGESGCGKTTAASLILLLQEPTAGEVRFRDKSLTGLSASARKAYSRDVQAVFQDPYGALNPRMRVGNIIGEPMEVHGYGRSNRRARLLDAIKAVELLDGSEEKFPHEFSGGQRQRIGIARALTMDPALIVLDEPVSNLDVSIRSQILNLLRDIQEERGISYMLISHDMASVEYMSHHIGVMYLGRLVEVGESEEVTHRPLHPYTATLVAAATPPGRTPAWQLPIIGEVPSPLDMPSGCAFHPRCPYAMDICKALRPTLSEFGQRRVACHLYPDRIDGIDKTLTASEV